MYSRLVCSFLCKKRIVLQKLRQKNKKKYAEDSLAAEADYLSKQKILSAKKENLELVKQRCKEIDTAASEEVTPKIECLQEFISVLETTHGQILDIRDWENLDFIIYYIETGRADTIKEALLLVDKQRQTDQLVQAIGFATQSVCQTINVGLGRLHDSMTKGFLHLSNQIVLQSQIIANETGALRSGISDMNSRLNAQAQYMKSLTSEINVNNALMEKANTNSMALVGDVNQIRNHADYAMRKLQNGR